MAKQFQVGQRVKYNQGRGKGLIAKVIRVEPETETLILKGEEHDLAFRRSFSAVRPASV